MRKKNYAAEVEDISIGLKNLTGQCYAVYDALFRGTFTPDTYEGAVFILLRETERLSELAEKIVQKMYECKRTQGGN